MAILRACAEDVERRLGDDHVVVELGCGASDKARILLQAVRPRAYVPIDISRASLLACAAHLVEAHPAMEVRAICADYTQRVALPGLRRAAPGGFSRFDTRQLRAGRGGRLSARLASAHPHGRRLADWYRFEKGSGRAASRLQ